jgi:radical SAM superfamily enzyme YgiQ (UPF0313 family)
MYQRATDIRIGFIALNLDITDPTFTEDRQALKLAVPSISGYLFDAGYENIRQYDFEVEPLRVEHAKAGSFPFDLLFDDQRVDAFLTGNEPGIRSMVCLALDSMQVDEADVFGLSCSAVIQKYERIHAICNLAMCMAKVLKERYPSSTMVVGGCSIQPDKHQFAEYREMMRRCPPLDFAVVGAGEAPMLHLVQHLTGAASFEDNQQTVEPCAQGVILHPCFIIQIRSDYLSESGAATRLEQDGRDHLFEALPPLPDGWTYARPERPAIFIRPFFDERLVANRKVSGRELLKRYRFPDPVARAMAPHHDVGSTMLPMIFIEGCNSKCAFCAHSSTRISARDARQAVRSIAWIRERYDTRYFHFLNTNINAYRAYAETFADALIEAKLDILWSDSANLRSLDDALLDKLRQSGLIRIATGLECPSDRLLKYVNKGLTTQKAFERLKASHEMGIWNHVQFIAGMPTETDDDIKANAEFIHRTAEYTNAYSISPFYLDFHSRMGVDPDAFGIRVLHCDDAKLEEGAFDEIGGLSWDQKKLQIQESTQRMYAAIETAKGDKRYCFPELHLDLLFWLYDSLGHQRKSEIVSVFEHRGAISAGLSAWGVSPEVIWAEKFIQAHCLSRGFFGYRVTSVDCDGRHNRVSVTLTGPDASPLILIIGTVRDMEHSYLRAGPLALSMDKQTPLDTPVREAAVRGFGHFLQRGVDAARALRRG